ncbi:MAG: hypothetical protein KDK37_15190, partial [Leptospiraceae bacterium]|nr:hypothetical protein [Leptospiraceae bacterium]
MNRILNRTIVTVLAVGFFFLAFYPNLATRDLSIVFLEYYRDANEKRVDVPESKIQEFMADKENGLHHYFPDSDCRFEPRKGVAEGRHCVVEARFITAAKVNEIMQAHPHLIDDRRTIVEPHWLERAFSFLTEKGVKNLTIKLGLDLQGGMRAIFEADYQ